MASRSKKKQQELRRGLLALVAVLAGLVVLAVVMVRMPQPQLPVETTVLPPNPYDEKDFQYDGKYLTCLSGPSVLGIDVSSHQQAIDWQQVAEAGIQLAMKRAF